jgi:hypothetical protein
LKPPLCRPPIGFDELMRVGLYIEPGGAYLPSIPFLSVLSGF